LELDFPEIDPERLPRARRHHHGRQRPLGRASRLSRLEGHKRGKDSVRAVVEARAEWGIEYLSLFAFSTENWDRPRREVNALMVCCGATCAPSSQDDGQRDPLRRHRRHRPPAVVGARLLEADIEATRQQRG
jgi:undecaprenyl pyrophosphate synthase